jgi:glycosyltransferase involved in cell wall biosynthesis
LYGLNETDILIVQTGKLNERKKILESIKAFKKIKNDNFRFIIAGVLDFSIEEEFNVMLTTDNRISFIGWKSLGDLIDLLCATDLYLQPGTQSVTMQQSLCCRCAVILHNYKSHSLYINENGWLINESSELTTILSSLNVTEIEKMKINSYEIAKKILDYKILALRILK